MVEPQSAADDSARITLTPDMRPLAPAQTHTEAKAPTRDLPPTRRRGGRGALIVGLLALLVGLGALGLSAWIYQEGQKEVLRLSTELAQLRVSLDLYARSGANNAALDALAERLTTLEDAEPTTLLPSISPDIAPEAAATTPANPTGNAEDCLPVGMRLLVAAGDSYPICEQTAEVTVSAVANGYITLSDGTSVASGGTTPLPGTPACTIAVTSSGDEGLTGYAEIRVNC